MARGKLQFDIIGDATKMAGSFIALGAVITVMSSAVRSLADFEQAMAKVAAISRSTEKEFAALRQNALDLGKSTVFTATQVASLEEAFARLGFTAREIINVSKDTLDIAAASGTALGRSAEIVGSTLRAFQLDVSQTQRVVDIMAGAFSTSALNMERFSVSMTPVAPIAAQLGISLTEVTAIMGLLADRGFEASVSGTAFRNILLLSAQAGITYQEALKKITDSTTSTATALDLFGRRGAAVATTLAGLTDEIDDQIIALDLMTDEAARQAEIMQDTLIGDWLKFTSALDGVIQKGTTVTTILRSVTQGITELITEKTRFEDLIKVDAGLLALTDRPPTDPSKIPIPRDRNRPYQPVDLTYSDAFLAAQAAKELAKELAKEEQATLQSFLAHQRLEMQLESEFMDWEAATKAMDEYRQQSKITQEQVEAMTNLFQPSDETADDPPFSGVVGGGPAFPADEAREFNTELAVMLSLTNLLGQEFDSAADVILAALQSITQALLQAAIAGLIFKNVSTLGIVGLALVGPGIALIRSQFNKGSESLKVRGRDLRGAASNEDKANRGLGA